MIFGSLFSIHLIDVGGAADPPPTPVEDGPPMSSLGQTSTDQPVLSVADKSPSTSYISTVDNDTEMIIPSTSIAPRSVTMWTKRVSNLRPATPFECIFELPALYCRWCCRTKFNAAVAR